MSDCVWRCSCAQSKRSTRAQRSKREVAWVRGGHDEVRSAGGRRKALREKRGESEGKGGGVGGKREREEEVRLHHSDSRKADAQLWTRKALHLLKLAAGEPSLSRFVEARGSRRTLLVRMLQLSRPIGNGTFASAQSFLVCLSHFVSQLGHLCDDSRVALAPRAQFGLDARCQFNVRSFPRFLRRRQGHAIRAIALLGRGRLSRPSRAAAARLRVDRSRALV
eukprot:6195049-Pleurochrysis_carterae.AAC.2